MQSNVYTKTLLMNKLKTLVTIALSIFIVGIASAKKADLTLNLTKGDFYNIKMEIHNDVNQQVMGQDMSIEQDILIKTQMHVIDVLESGDYLIEQKYSNIKLDMLMNDKEMNIDSENVEEGKENPLSAITDLVISFEVSPQGIVDNVKGHDEMMEKLSTNPQIEGVLKGLVSNDQMHVFFSYLPKNTVKPGDNYEVVLNNVELMNLSTTTYYTVEEINKKNVVLDVLTDFGMDAGKSFQQNGMDLTMMASGKQMGNFIVSRKDGMPVSSDSDMDLHMDISFKNPANGEDMTMPMDMKINSIITVTKQ